MNRKQRVFFLLLVCGVYSLTAQIDDDRSYQGFKVDKFQNQEGVEFLTITVLPLGNGILFFRDANGDKPLTGVYRFIISDNKYVTGTIFKGLAQGEWEEYFYGRLFEKSTYKKGRYHGKIQLYEDHPAADAHYAEYTVNEGVAQHFISYYKNGKVKKERFYENGKVHGIVKTLDENGRLIEEYPYRQGVLQGKAMKIDSKAYKEETEYSNGKKNGKYALYYPNGNIAEKGTYNAKSEKTDKWIYKAENGDMQKEEEYLEGKLNGKKKEYYTGNRLKSEEEYANGRLHGKMVYYDEEPYLISSEGGFANGERHGKFKMYHNGILWRESLYNNGKEVGKKEFEDGKLQIIKLLDEKGMLIEVEQYDKAGKKVYKNNKFKKHASIKLKENAFGIIDIELE